MTMGGVPTVKLPMAIGTQWVAFEEPEVIKRKRTEYMRRFCEENPRNSEVVWMNGAAGWLESTWDTSAKGSMMAS